MMDLILDIIKSGTGALVMCKISKAIGQKDISEIIAGAGWTIVGVDCIKLTLPFCKWLQSIGENIGEFISGCGEVVDKISGILN